MSDSYRKLLHKQFEYHSIYDSVKKISERGKADDWSNEDECCYEILDRDITAAMLRAAEKCLLGSSTIWHGHLLSARLLVQFGTGQGEYRRTAFGILMIVSYITSWNIPMWMHHILTKPCRLKSVFLNLVMMFI
jgi:hypothetical protein